MGARHSLKCSWPLTEVRSWVATLNRAHQERSFSIAPDDRQDFTCDVARAAGCGQEHKGGSNLFGLSGAFHRGVLAKFYYLVSRFVGWIEGRPDRTGRHGVHANATRYEMTRERPRESVNPALGHRI